MTTNIGDADRVGRLLAGATIGFLFVRLRLGPPWYTTMGVVTLYLLATALLAWDPIYIIFRYSTRSPTDASSTVRKVE
ncbi:MAG TPA: YgaP-like transmembrane domain [Gemmatimonadaceae bacterium]|nr:YgaP-like transmembrane domain [Gemmatimonadaceae bacterium]